MSDTRRHVAVEQGWTLGNPEFDKWNAGNAQYRKRKPVQSLKHQSRDRNGRGKDGGQKGSFRPHVKNCRYNLRQKIDDLRDQESRDAATED